MIHHKALLSKIEDYFISGCKEAGQMELGLEAEHFVVEKDSRKSVPYAGKNGVQDTLLCLSPQFEGQYRESDSLLGLSNQDAALSLEPGSQLEISVRHSRRIADVGGAYERYYQMINGLLSQRGQTLVSEGYLPLSRAEEITIIPKERYRFMDAHFRKTGKMGVNMMRGTASCQVAIDYFDENDFVKKYQCACILSPVLALIASNTPTFEGKANSNPLIRTKIWRNVDPERTGILHSTFQSDFSFKKYAEYVLSQKAIFTVKDGKHQASGSGVLDLLCGSDDYFDDFLLYLSLVFPDVRLRQYVEIRVADSMSIENTYAYMALIKGLFSDMRELGRLLEHADWSYEAFISAQDAIMENGANAVVYGQPALRLIDELTQLALRNLEDDEKGFLLPFVNRNF